MGKKMGFCNKILWATIFFGIFSVITIFYKLVSPDETTEYIDYFFGSFWFSVVLNYTILFLSSILYISTGEINAPIKERKKSIYSAILIVGSTISILKDTAFSGGVSFYEKLIIVLLLMIPHLIIIVAMAVSFFKKYKDRTVDKSSGQTKNKE